MDPCSEMAYDGYITRIPDPWSLRRADGIDLGNGDL